MNPKYRFSPIKSKEELLEAIKYIHFECHKLCQEVLGRLLPNSGNVGIFCHFDEEFALLTKLRERLTIAEENWNNKYYHLREPIVVPAKGDIPETSYEFLYIRQPDPDLPQVGDIDFFLPTSEYSDLKQSIINSEPTRGISLANHPTLDMIKLSNENSDAWGFITTHKMSDEFKK